MPGAGKSTAVLLPPTGTGPVASQSPALAVWRLARIFAFFARKWYNSAVLPLGSGCASGLLGQRSTVTEESSRPQRDEENPVVGPLSRLGAARRFDVLAAPRRWAVQGRMRTVRLILIVLAAVTIAIVAYAQYLAWRPDTSAEATLAALNQAMFEQTFATATPLPTVPTATQAPPPTETPTPKPTNTLVPVPTGRPRTRPTVAAPVASPTELAAPTLIAPGDGMTALAQMVFEWAWDGPPLEENQAFDLRIWSAQEEQNGSPRRGVVPPTRQTSVEVSLAAVPAIVDYGPGEYFWTVVVVELQANGSPRVAGTWGESRRLIYR